MMHCPKCGAYFMNQRSNEANRYYWSLLEILGDHFGYTPLEVHEEMKIMFNPKSSKLGTGYYGGSTTELDVLAFQMYLENIRIWAARDHGIALPLPNKE